MPEVIFDKVNLQYSICTLPRVGSFYLQDRILQHTNVYVKKYHSLKDNKMITIIRDPIEMLTSKLAMTVFYEKEDETINQIRNNETTKDLTEYLAYIDQVSLDRFAIIIDYKDLINHPFETTKAVANIMNLPIINQDYKENMIKEYPEYSHLVSSRKATQYDEILSYVEQLDLSALYGFYDKAITRVISPIS